jgi:hypothetical protein
MLTISMEWATMDEIEDVRVGFADQAAKLQIRFRSGRTVHIPMSDQVALVLNAGGWMMGEHCARAFEQDLGGSNLVSRRIRMISDAARLCREPGGATGV